MKDNLFPIIALFIIFLAVFNASKQQQTGHNMFYNGTSTGGSIEQQLYQAQQDTKKLEQDVATYNSSVYKDKLFLRGGYGYDADSEYIEIYANYSNTAPIKITGLTLKSTSTLVSVVIPKSTNLYFSGMVNSEEDVYLAPGQSAYIVTGRSPIGYGQHVNKCSGYLSQFNRFSPSLYTSCPRAQDEDLSSVPRTNNNENCYDLIFGYPSCWVQTTPLSNAYSPECQNFIYTKMTYANCVNVHKNDKDFWGNYWYVYLKRGERIWKDRRETILLIDDKGKTIDRIYKY